MNIFLIFIAFQIFVVVVAIFAFLFLDKRYRKKHGTDIPDGFVRTEEISIDPIDGKRLRVYYNSLSGERFYHEEKSK